MAGLAKKVEVEPGLVPRLAGGGSGETHLNLWILFLTLIQ